MIDHRQLHALDARLKRLLDRIDRQADPSTVTAEARRVIDDHRGALVRDNWEQAWRNGEFVAWAWFGDIRRDREARALHVAFTELVRYVLDSSTPFLRAKHTKQLRGALAEYLSHRGVRVSHAPQSGRLKVVDPGEDGWSSANSIQGWAKIFGISRNTMPGLLKSQTIRNKSLGRNLFMVAVADLPAVHRDRHRRTTK